MASYYFDDFDGANADPIGAPWVQHSLDAGTKNIIRNNDKAEEGSGSGDANCHYDETFSSPDVLLNAEYDGGILRLFGRLASPGDSSTGYLMEYVGSGETVRIYRINSGYDDTTELDSAAGVEATFGDFWRFEIEDDQLTAYLNDVEVASASDSTYTAAGYAGFGLGEFATLRSIEISNLVLTEIKSFVDVLYADTQEVMGVPLTSVKSWVGLE